MLTMPTRNGFMLEWYTGEIKELKYKNGKTKTIRCKGEFTNKSKEIVEAKKAELEKAGVEIIGIYECIF